jgi:penicillin-binding protein 2
VVFIAALMVVVTGFLAARLFSLTVVSGTANRQLAESRLDRSTLLPTVRGTITDRKGRVLAESVPSYDLAIHYDAISGQWVQSRAIEFARKEAGPQLWSQLDPSEREMRIAEHASEFQRRLDDVLTAAVAETGLSRTELDDRISAIRTQVERKANAVWNRQLDLERAKYGEGAEEQFNGRPIREQAEAHVVATQLPTKNAFALRKLADAMPGIIQVDDGTRREYPWNKVEFALDRSMLPRPIRSSKPLRMTLNGVADHVIGSVREEVWIEDLDRRPYRSETAEGEQRLDLGGYRPGRDMIGIRGLERTYEDVLRGARGRVVERLDTGQVSRTEPTRGRDIQLTVDIALQSRVQALFDSKVGLARAQQWHFGWYDDGAPKPMPLPFLTPLNGAAVVLDVETGETLALFSWPTIAEGDTMEPKLRDRAAAAVNRAVETPYPPGSIIKPIVYVSAVKSGVFAADGTVTCSGHFFGAQDQFGRCWIYRPQFRYLTHSDPKQVNGPLNVEAAISRSCNIFFYTLAQRMGLANLCNWYRAFGMGQVLDIGLARMEVNPKTGQPQIVGERPGILPSAEAIARITERRDVVTPVIAGIGQGPIGWTPLQAANAYAILARGGEIRDPTILRTPMPGRMIRRTGSLELVPQSCQRALEGLRQAVEERFGTGHHLSFDQGSQEKILNAPGVVVWAKTGTAQAPPLKIDDDGDGKAETIITGLEHGWFVGLVANAGEHRPRYAVAVVLEHGGSGGKCAGPIANAVIHALVAEGYLGASARSGTAVSDPDRAAFPKDPNDVDPEEGAEAPPQQEGQ